MNREFAGIGARVPSAMRSYSIVVPAVLGMVTSYVSIMISNPWWVIILATGVASFATLLGPNRLFSWIIFASVFAANPVNNTTPITVNLVLAFIFFVLNTQYLRALPKPLLLVNFLLLLSVFGSVFNWSKGLTPDNFANQSMNIINFILGPFLLIPLLYSRLQEEQDHGMLVKGLVFGLVVPTVVFLTLAVSIGDVVSDSISTRFGYEVNVSIYRLGGIDFILTRTQAGIVLASLLCAAFAVAINSVTGMVRLTASLCIAGAALLIMITGSVGSSMAGLCGIALILIVGKRYLSIKRYVIMTIIVVPAVFAAWSVLPEGVQRYATARYDERFASGTVDASDRTTRWQRSFEYLTRNPTGVGWSLYVEPIATYPHNDYLSYAIAFGIICGMLYLLVPLAVLFYLVRFKPSKSSQGQTAIVLAGVGVATVFLINSFSDHLTANKWYFNVVWSIIWYAFFSCRTRTTSVRHRLPKHEQSRIGGQRA